MFQSEYFLPAIGWQKKLVECKQLNICVHGGRQIGKSRTFISMQTRDLLAGKRQVYSGPTQDIADNNFLDIANAFAELNSPLVRVNKVQRGVIEIRTEDGKFGTYRRMSASRQAMRNIRGQRAHSIFHDEIQLADDSAAYFQATKALTSTTRGRTYMAMTSPANSAQFHNSTWIMSMLERAGILSTVGTDKEAEAFNVKGFPNWYFLRRPTSVETLAPLMRARFILDDEEGAAQRPMLYWETMADDYLEETRNEIGQKAFDREFRCAWMLETDSLVIDYFREDWHVDAQKAEYNPDYPVYWALDRGEGNAYTVLLMFQRIPAFDSFKRPFMQYNFFDEFRSKNRRHDEEDWILDGLRFSTDTTYEPALTLENEWERKRPYQLPEMCYPDPRAKGFVDAVGDAGLRCYTRNVPVETAIDRINHRISSGRVMIHPRCKLLISNFQKWTRDSKGFPVDTMDMSDAAQACGYGLVLSEAFFRDEPPSRVWSQDIVGGGGNNEVHILTL